MVGIEVPVPVAGTVDEVKNGTQVIKIASAWLLVFMLAVAASIVTITVVNNKNYGPEGTVASYLKALKDGNGAKALGLLQAKVPSANAAVLDGAPLAKSMQGVDNITIGEAVDGPDGQRMVTVSYKVDDTALSTDFKLVPGSKHWLFFDSWKMVPSTLPVIDASVVNANEASINGVPVNMPDSRSSFAVFYPGRYSLEYRSELFAAPPVVRAVTGPDNGVAPVALATGPTSELLSQVDGAIHSYLDECTKQAVLMPAGCPMSAGTDNRVTSEVHWSIADYPAISISPFGGQWVMAPLTVKAQVQFEEQNLFTGIVSEVKTAEDFTFSAKLAINGTNVSVTPMVNY